MKITNQTRNDHSNSDGGSRLSDSNRTLIAAGRSPIVDTTWVKHYPQHAAYLGETLEHHHVGQGSRAVPLPETLHDAYTVFHPQRRVVGTPTGGTKPLPPQPTRQQTEAEIARQVAAGRIRGRGITAGSPPPAPTVPASSEVAAAHGPPSPSTPPTSMGELKPRAHSTTSTPHALHEPSLPNPLHAPHIPHGPKSPKVRGGLLIGAVIAGVTYYFTDDAYAAAQNLNPLASTTDALVTRKTSALDVTGAAVRDLISLTPPGAITFLIWDLGKPQGQFPYDRDLYDRAIREGRNPFCAQCHGPGGALDPNNRWNQRARWNQLAQPFNVGSVRWPELSPADQDVIRQFLSGH